MTTTPPPSATTTTVEHHPKAGESAASDLLLSLPGLPPPPPLPLSQPHPEGSYMLPHDHMGDLLSTLVREATNGDKAVVQKAAGVLIWTMTIPVDLSKVMGMVAAFRRYAMRHVWLDREARGFWALCALDCMTRHTKGAWVELLSLFPYAAGCACSDLAAWMVGAAPVYLRVLQTVLAQAHWVPLAYFFRRAGLLAEPAQASGVPPRVLITALGKHFGVKQPAVVCSTSFPTSVAALALMRAERARRVWLYATIYLEEGEAPCCVGCGVELTVVLDDCTKPVCVGGCTRDAFGELLCAACAGIDAPSMRLYVSEELVLHILALRMD